MPRSTIERPPGAAPVEAFIGLGANLGDPHATLNAAFDTLAALPASTLLQRSAIYRTAHFRSRLEARARSNLQHSLAALQG